MKRKGIRYLVSICIALGVMISLSPIQALGQGGSELMIASISDQSAGDSIVSLENFLTELENNYNVNFFYQHHVIKNKYINVRPDLLQNSEDKKRGELVAELLTQLGIKYDRLDEQNYILFQNEADAEGFMQMETVSGQITDAETEETLPGVNILVKGTTIGTTTNMDGQYSLDVPSLQDTLVFSFIGYQTQEVPINGRTSIDVVMRSQALTGEELVVVGYGTQQRKDLTGSISSIRSDEFEDGVSPSVDQLIGNKVAGVRMVQSSSQPGSGASINIRGASSINAGTGPLYVVDGLPIDKSSAADASGNGFTAPPGSRNPLNSINPGDIESIEILKDASATAIYGSRGANGVILITTKQGRQDQFNVDYNGYAGVQSVANTMDVMSATEYQNVLNAIVDAGGGTEGERVGDIQGSGTDWQDLIYDNAAPVMSHNLSFSGGSEMVTYHASLNYFGQQGIVKNSSMDRYNARLNFGITPSDKFNIKVNLNTAYIKDDYVANGFGINYFAGVIQTATSFDPTLQVRDSDGEYVRSPFISMDNPIAILNDEESFANTYRTLGTVKAQYNFTSPGFLCGH
ncbi:SusC/RagA family TonB-linked outer membrane protein [Aliifodinibius sp. S!AR15-10]|uniref:SusC/RagA family TonB-linked outer membrane protein n=1 Tax=Aliifodinibius sp. S!AR15-10 TaxID=2950437 RepID=UPI0028668C58|nr:SusC/RagA family TonB-linked outer membrane protein [Aliifodinibius sp. S!AR15-10]MDR8392416.1 SusC/RagA family TonB-linked outer membrane protein [Aliifodinibius sp. S!AR15-10]